MKQMKFFCIQVLATVCCVALLVACTDDDDYVAPAPSTIDTSEWPLTCFMDTLNYRAGDDFFMYCNGTYWKNTESRGKSLIGLFYTEAPDYINQLVSQTDIPLAAQLDALTNAVIRNPLTAEEMNEYMAPVMEVINAASTREDCIRLFARLYKLGYNKALHIGSFVVDGVLKPTLGVPFRYPVHPLVHTRSDGNDVISILAAELGLNPQDLLVSDGDVEKFATFVNAPVELMKEDLTDLVWMMDQPYMNPELVAESHAYFKRYSPGSSFYDWIIDIYYNCRYTASYAFATKWITQSMIEDMEGKCEELRSVFRRRIADLDWMSGTTKNRAIEKLDLMNVCVGYPKNWVTEAMVDFGSCQTMVEAARLARKADVALLLSFLGKDVKTHAFNAYLYTYKSSGDLCSVNAFYMPTFNSVFIFPAFLLPPMYETDAHESLNYATLYTIGHEMTHGFDSAGANYDGMGNYRNWWTVQDRMDFEERYQQLIDCYNRLEMLPWDPNYAGKYCPGEQTLIENIADLGGFEIARQAFIEKCQREGYYGEELDKQERKFYQAYANYWRTKYSSETINYCMFETKETHSMDRERINGVVMNTDRWYELYNVQWGDNLYLRPDKRTHIW